MTSPRSSARDATVINLRAPASAKALIDRAAAASGRTRTDFVLEAALAAARETLLDQTFFALDEAQFAAFQRILDEPVADNPALERLLSHPTPWKR